MDWTEDLSTSIDEIDDKQKELIRRVGLLLNTFDVRRGPEEVGRFLGYLQDHVVTHFEMEEQYMLLHSYPGYAAHREEHRRFVSTVSDLREKFVKDGGNSRVILRAAVNLVTHHIRTTDKAMGDFIKGIRFPHRRACANGGHGQQRTNPAATGREDT